MIHAVHVRNFQALHDVELRLEPFTVIVGPSNVGKSAFMRAMRTLTSNRRGNDFISHGERTAVITATTDRGTVTLTRSKNTTDNAYTVTPDDPQHPLYPERTFTKLGGETPPEVSDFLGITAKDAINYASQFDKPYLLDDSAGEAARVLGALTNVSIIFEAARESNRRKLAASQILRTRAADLAAIKEKIPKYRSLKQQAAALTEAEQHISAARSLEKQITTLEQAITTVESTRTAMQPLQQQAARAVPDAQPMLDAYAALQRLITAMKEQLSAQKQTGLAQERLEAAAAQLTEAETAHTELLGDITDTLAGWFGALEQPGDVEHIEGTPYIKRSRALEIFTQYIETKATA